MDKWVSILLEAEDKWATFAMTHSLAAREIGTFSYSCERDKYKAQYIFENYGYEYYQYRKRRTLCKNNKF